MPDVQLDTKKAILEALEAKYGIVTDSCRSIGLARSTFYDWLKTDPEFKAAVDDIQDVALDYAEGKLFQKMSGVQMVNEDGEFYTQPPSDTALIFYLKCKGKKRGYIERTEVAPVNPDGSQYTTPIIIQPIQTTSAPIETKETE